MLAYFRNILYDAVSKVFPESLLDLSNKLRKLAIEDGFFDSNLESYQSVSDIVFKAEEKQDDKDSEIKNNENNEIWYTDEAFNYIIPFDKYKLLPFSERIKVCVMLELHFGENNNQVICFKRRINFEERVNILKTLKIPFLYKVYDTPEVFGICIKRNPECKDQFKMISEKESIMAKNILQIVKLYSGYNNEEQTATIVSSPGMADTLEFLGFKYKGIYFNTLCEVDLK